MGLRADPRDAVVIAVELSLGLLPTVLTIVATLVLWVAVCEADYQLTRWRRRKGRR